jgi:hypothetical protein
MCDCGCNTCETKSTLMLNESLAPRAILSEGLKYHMDANKPLTEHLYRAGSDSYFNLWAEARSLYSREILEITHEDDLAILTETNLGHFGMFEGKKVPLDFPMLDEQGEDTAWEDEEGSKVTLQDILDMTKNIPQKDYPTEKLAKVVLNWDDNPEEIDRISQVEISKQYPILIMVDEGGKIQWILDGNHRAQKALRAKSKTIPAKLIKPSNLDAKAKKVLLGIPMLDEGTYEEGGEDDRKYALLKVRPENYNLMIDKLQDMNINHTRHSGTEGVIKIYTDIIPDKVLYRLTHDVWVDKFVLKEAKNDNKPIGKPMRDTSGGKAYKVYVKDPKTGNIKTVRFGSGGLKAKINNPKARQAFAARHKCSTRNDKTKASYWSCRLPRYAKLLGLKSSFTGFW